MKAVIKGHAIPAIAIALVLALAVAFGGCAGQQKTDVISTSYKVLVSARTAYDAAFKSLADLYARGLLDDEERYKAVQAGNKFVVAYLSAVNALETYYTTDAVDDAETALEAVDSALYLYSVLMDLITPYLLRGGDA